MPDTKCGEEPTHATLSTFNSFGVATIQQSLYIQLQLCSIVASDAPTQPQHRSAPILFSITMRSPTKRIRPYSLPNEDMYGSTMGLELEIDSPFALRHRHHQHATTSPILHLPPELLTEIFIYTAMFSYSFERWIPVTHVCRRWYDIARGNPALWAWLPFVFPIPHQSPYNRRWEKLASSAAGLVPLHVRIRSNTWKPRYNAYILGFISRIKTLGIQFDTPDKLRHKEYLKAWSSPAPLLESLNIRWDPEKTGCSWIKHEMLPPTLFGGSTPKLRHLSLENCGAIWQGRDLFKKLTTLSIKKPDEGSKIEISELLDVLSQNPGLTALTLDSVLAEPRLPRFEPIGDQTKVSLPKLSSLRYRGSNLDEDLALMHHLHLALGPRIHFISGAEAEDPVAAFINCTRVLQHVRGLPVTKVQQMTSLEESRQGFHYKDWVNIHFDDEKGVNNTPTGCPPQVGSIGPSDKGCGSAACYTDIELSLTKRTHLHNVATRVQPSSWSGLLLNDCTANLLCIHLDDIDVQPIDAWEHILSSSPNLRRLDLRSRSGVSFLQYLVNMERSNRKSVHPCHHRGGTAVGSHFNGTDIVNVELIFREVNFGLVEADEAIRACSRWLMLRLEDCQELPALRNISQVTNRGGSRDPHLNDEGLVSVFGDEEPPYFEPAFLGEANREPEYDHEGDLVYVRNVNDDDHDEEMNY